jgi:hypothetical protein
LYFPLLFEEGWLRSSRGGVPELLQKGWFTALIEAATTPPPPAAHLLEKEGKRRSPLRHAIWRII